MHKKLRLGTLFDMNIGNMNMAAGGMPVPHHSREFIRFPGAVYRLGRMVPGTATTPPFCPIKAGASSNPLRTFVWCPYIPGSIALVPANLGHTIFTGRMSGCWLVRCRVNGAPYFAHVGTAHNAYDPATLAVKQAFRIAVRAGTIRVQSAFQPMALGAQNTLGAMSARGNFLTYGFSTAPPVAPAGGAAGAAPAPGPAIAAGGQVVVSAPFNAQAPKLQVVSRLRVPGQPLPADFS